MPRARAQTTRARYIMRPGAGEARVARVTIAVGDQYVCILGTVSISLWPFQFPVHRCLVYLCEIL